MKRILPLLIVLPLLWAATTFITNSERRIGFKIKNFGVMVDGTIEGFSGNLQFNPKQLESSIFDFSLDVKSIRTGITQRDKDIMAPDFLMQKNIQPLALRQKNLKLWQPTGMK